MGEHDEGTYNPRPLAWESTYNPRPVMVSDPPDCQEFVYDAKLTNERFIVSKDKNGNEIFLVTEKDENGAIHQFNSTADGILCKVGMAGCSPIVSRRVYRTLISAETLETLLMEVEIHGCWHDPLDPELIEGIIAGTGEVVFSGYCTDY